MRCDTQEVAVVCLYRVYKVSLMLRYFFLYDQYHLFCNICDVF